MSLKNYLCILIVVSINLLINTRYIVVFLPLSILLLTFILLGLFLLLVHYGLIFDFNSKASIFTSFTCPKFYFVLFGVSVVNFIIDYSTRVYQIFFKNTLIAELERKRLKRRISTSSSKIIVKKYSSRKINNSHLHQSKKNNNIHNINMNSISNISNNINNHNNDISQSKELLNKKSKLFNKTSEKEDEKVINKDGEGQSIYNIRNDSNKKINFISINNMNNNRNSGSINAENVSPFSIMSKKSNNNNNNLKNDYTFKNNAFDED